MRRVTRGQENVRIVLAEGAETSQGRQLLGWASDDEGCPWVQAERGWEVEVWPWGVGQGLRLERRHPACCPRRREGTTLPSCSRKNPARQHFFGLCGAGEELGGGEGKRGASSTDYFSATASLPGRLSHEHLCPSAVPRLPS